MTNRAAAPIRNMEPLIIERIRLAFPQEAFTIERVSSIVSPDEFSDLVVKSPALCLAWMGVRPEGSSARTLRGRAQWRLILIYKSSAKPENRFRGDAFGWGLDDMVDVAMMILHGWTIADVGSCYVSGSDAVGVQGFEDQQVVVAQVDFEVSFTSLVSALDVVTTGDLERIGATWIVNGSEETVTETIEPRI